MPTVRGMNKIRLVGYRALRVAVAVSLVANVAVAWWVGQLQARMSELGPTNAPEGLVFAPLTGVDADGSSVTIDPAASDLPTVLYVLARDCVYCARNYDNVQSLVAKASDSHRFIGISTSSTGIENLRAKYPFPIFGDVPVEKLMEYGFRGTPYTLVIDPSGAVKRRWMGAYHGAIAMEIENWFGVPLPGLLQGVPVRGKEGLVLVTPHRQQ